MIIFSILCFNLDGPRPQLNGCCHQGAGQGLVFQSTEHFDQHDDDGGSDHCDKVWQSVTKCDKVRQSVIKCDKVWQALIFQSEMHYDQHDDDLVALIVVKISKDWTPLVTFFLSLSEVLPEHHRDPRARMEASQNLGSSPVVVGLYETLQIFQPP